MSSSIKLISPTNPEKWVFITHESGWKNTKIYANGKLVKSFENPQELKKGIVDEIDGLGMMKFSLHPATLRPLSIVNGENFFREKKKQESVKEMNGVIIIFSILALLNFLIFLMAMVRLNANILPSDLAVTEMIAIFTGGFTALYTASAILFARGIYFMYFLRTGFFFASTVWIMYNIYHAPDDVQYIFVIARFILLGILGIYFKRVLAFMKVPKERTDHEILDDTF